MAAYLRIWHHIYVYGGMSVYMAAYPCIWQHVCVYASMSVYMAPYLCIWQHICLYGSIILHMAEVIRAVKQSSYALQAELDHRKPEETK